MSDGQAIEPVSGEVRVPGFRPGAVYEIEWWDTYAQEKTILAVQEVVPASSGDLKSRSMH